MGYSLTVMWLERFIDSIMPGLVPFMACLLALVVYDIIRRTFIVNALSMGITPNVVMK